MAHVPQTVPYAWPYDGGRSILSTDRLAVVACGVQDHWLAHVVRPSELPGAHAVVAGAREQGVHVEWVRHGAAVGALRPVDRALPEVGSAPWQLAGDVHPEDLVVDVPALDGFVTGELDLQLRWRGIDRLALVGVGTETTVSSTNRSANDRGFECLTLSDAVLHHDDDTGAASLSSVCMSGGIFGAVGTSENLLAAVAAT